MGLNGPQLFNLDAKALFLAEKVEDWIEGVPWPVTAFLCRTKAEKLYVEHFKPEEPECERFRRARKGIEIGTYKAGVKVTDIRDDILDAMGKLK